ncbi:hypothetical protein ACFIOY_32425 [Bradyrhizobium sp. TZ2]
MGRSLAPGVGDHNLLATHPIPFDLIPGATHWFERDGDIECSHLGQLGHSSITNLRMAGEPVRDTERKLNCYDQRASNAR